MSDTRYPKRTGSGDFDDLDDPRNHAGGDARAEDPLAELARLIDEDPFADFNSRRREPTASPDAGQRTGPTFSAPPVEVEPEEDYEDDYAQDDYAQDEYAQDEYAREDYAAEPYRAPEEPVLPDTDDMAGATDYDRESTERLYADLAAASQRVEPSFSSEYRRPAPPPEAAPPSQDWGQDDYEEPAFEQPAARETIIRAEAAPQYAEPEPAYAEPEYRAETADFGAASQEDASYAETDPVFDDSGHIPPYEGEYAEETTGRRKGTLVVAGLLGLIVLGGASALIYRGIFGEESDGPPPVIRADKSPSKIEPKDTADSEPQQGKLVYDRVGGDASTDDTRLVSREEPVADVGGRQVRVIDPNQEEGTGLRGAAVDTAADGAAGSEELPKRVRTVVVKPDGTIVGEIEAPKPAEPLQPAALPGSEPAAADSVATETASTETSAVPIPEPKPVELASNQAQSTATPVQTQPQTTATAPEPTPAPAPAPTPAAAQPKPVENFVPPAAPATQQKSGQPLQLNPDVAATLPAAQKPTTTASAPVQTQTATQQQTASAPTAAAPTAVFPPGSYVVQVAASRSEQDAQGTAASINQRYASVLSGFTPTVERADLGDRGIYYRVGVGPMKSQGDASSLCAKLKSAGLDCFVRRN